MSRIGNAPIELSNGVTVTVENKNVNVKGPKGELSIAKPNGIDVKVDANIVTVSRQNEEKPIKALHGLTRSLINNMVIGVSKGYEKKLEVNGVGFKVQLSGKTLKMALGYSHDIEFTAPEGVDLAVEGNVITVSGIDKQQVGQTAAEIRALRKPEPYKGKGIKYVDEYIIRKAGKSVAGAGAA